MVQMDFLAANHVHIFGLCGLVCRLSVCLSVVGDVLYCGEMVHLS